MGEEQTLWKGSPSQVTQLGIYLLCGVTFWLVVPIFIALWKWLELRDCVYELTSERLKQTRGVFSKQTDEVELYRVKDLTVEQPLFLRLFALENVILETSDKSSPRVVIAAVPEAQQLGDIIRRQVEEIRQRKRVREIDLE